MKRLTQPFGIMMHLPRPFRIVALILCLPCWAAPAWGQSSQPAEELPPRLTKDQLHQLEKMAEQLNRYRWGDPVVETFDKADAVKPWKTAMAGKVAVKDGKLIVSSKQKNQYFTGYRMLPEAIRGAPGVRVEAIVSMDKVERTPRVGMFIGGQAQNIYRWECMYYFAYSSNGRFQQIRAMSRSTGGSGEAMPEKKDVKLTIEIAGRKLRAARGKDSPINALADSPVPLNKNTPIGINGRLGGVKISRITYWPLVLDVTDQQRQEAWKGAPLGGQAQFDRYVTEHILPDLASESWRQRQDATRLLTRLMPLPRRVLAKAMEKTEDPEVEVRIGAVLQTSHDVDIPKPPPQPRKSDKPEPTPRTGPDEKQ
jgi:hypothetical protein